MPQKVALITGSVRTPRVGPDVADWVASILPQDNNKDGIEIERVAIADFKLPVFDEFVIPAMVPTYAQFQHEHSKKWSDAIRSFAGYIFVTPEYNAGVPGGVKNAIDYLYSEWPGKPAAVISYGMQGGIRANEQLAYTLEMIMKLKVVEPRVEMAFSGGSGQPDSIAASTQGKLGDDTKKEWTENGNKEKVLRAFEALSQIVKEQATEEKVAKAATADGAAE
ncbi:hypothetical protein GJ744_004044 [Endocarpon pusillum]|uniref:NADPH-dependent FMN reductase-like domain-containing protein n=1 Tax=Endocarpon pusillum TaxID=364733 RepID=A0A8H7A638_9EURO|nr:hypothetical protein GJ744_004044 [Endocarpon pusillum]